MPNDMLNDMPNENGNNNQNLVTRSEASEITGYSISAIRDWIDKEFIKKHVKSSKKNATVYIDITELQEWLTKNGKPFKRKPAGTTPSKTLIVARAKGRPGLIASRQKSIRPISSIGARIWSSSPTETPPELINKSWDLAAWAITPRHSSNLSGKIPRSVTTQPRALKKPLKTIRLES